ncbi:hypothetical protein IWQ57_000987 [Coemansia nantahalensis]|uniref:Uncharacterized protein n=1 Tax=Coemansia nantahalensis TaxID=2789366 RepID=A0ACC1K697_9FUNG|nr:hypothetical protein IWQ57_000987 [Coemansia nantahalensis]
MKSEPLDVFAAGLAYLGNVHVDYDDERIYFIPSMYAGELRHMTLRNMPANHEWSSFATEDDSQQIMFTELQSLRLLYNRLYMDDDSGEPIEHGDDHPWTLQFPALETAAIHCTVDRCPLLEYAEFPEIMDSLHIEARPAVFRAIARRGLPAARRLSLEVSRGSGANPSVFADLDAILDSAGMSEELALCCSDRELRVVRGDITCRALTRLEVSGPVSVDAMVGLVGTLPNLVRLALWQLTFEERETNLPIPEPEESGWVAPLSTKLARLTISYHPDRYSAAEVVPAAQYMLLRAPALETFVAPHYVQERMAEFVQRFAQQAPRLAEVTLERC